MRPLAESLAAEGYTVELPRLPGHGATRWQELGKATWRDWAREVIAAHERLVACTRARVVVAMSFGGALGLYLAQTRGDELSGIVLINPMVTLKHPLVPTLPVLKRVVPFIPGVINDIAKPDQDEVGYDKVAPRAIAEMVDFQRIVQSDLRLVTTPALVFTSRDDHVVPTRNSRIILDGISSEDVTHKWLERSYHVATLDYDAPEIEADTKAFVKRTTS